MRRITVSLPDHLVDAAVAAVEAGRATSESAYVADALAGTASRESYAEFLADLRRDVGAPTAEETEWAQRSLGLV